MRLTLDSFANAITADPRILAGLTLPGACDALDCVDRHKLIADMKWAEERVMMAVKNNFGTDLYPTQVTLRSKSPTFATEHRPVTLKSYSVTANVAYSAQAGLPWSLQIAALEADIPAFEDECEAYEYAEVVEEAGFCKRFAVELELDSFTYGSPNTVTLTTHAYNLASFAPDTQIYDAPISDPQPAWLPSTVNLTVYTSVPSKIVAYYNKCACGTASLDPICGTCYAIKTSEFCYKTDGYWLMPDTDCKRCNGMCDPYEFTLKAVTKDNWSEVVADATVSIVSQRLPLELCFCRSNQRVKRDLGILEQSNEDIRRFQPYFSMRNPFGYSTPGANSAWASLTLAFGGMEGGAGVM